MKTSRKFATSPNVLVADGKNSVANATVLVAISSPVSGLTMTIMMMMMTMFIITPTVMMNHPSE